MTDKEFQNRIASLKRKLAKAKTAKSEARSLADKVERIKEIDSIRGEIHQMRCRYFDLVEA